MTSTEWDSSVIVAAQLLIEDANGNTVIQAGPTPEIDIIDPTSGVTMQLAQQLSVPESSQVLPGIQFMKAANTSPAILVFFGADNVGQIFTFSGGYTNPSALTAYARSQHAKNNASIGIVNAAGAGLGGRLDCLDTLAKLVLFSTSSPDTTLNQLQVLAANSTTKLPMILEGETWHTPTFQNSWTGSMQYRLDPTGRVQFQGSITPGTRTGGTVITNLPAGYRPAVANEYVTSWTGGGFWNKVSIGTNGDIAYFDGSGSGSQGGMQGVNFSTF